MGVNEHHLSTTHRATESNTLQEYVTSVMDSDKGNLELSLVYMERRFNIYSIIWGHLQLIDDIFHIFEDIFNSLKTSSNNWRYLQLYEDTIYNCWTYIRSMVFKIRFIDGYISSRYREILLHVACLWGQTVSISKCLTQNPFHNSTWSTVCAHRNRHILLINLGMKLHTYI